VNDYAERFTIGNIRFLFKSNRKIIGGNQLPHAITGKKGRLAVSGRKLKKFIGKTLLIKSRIAENLYIFDSPPETWENEQLDKLHGELKKSFDLHDRFRDVSEGLGIVKDNLELFKDILQYRNSLMLEWIVIILIAIEVIHLFVKT